MGVSFSHKLLLSLIFFTRFLFLSIYKKRIETLVGVMIII